MLRWGQAHPEGIVGVDIVAECSRGCAAAMKDESAAVLAWTPPAPVAKTQGKLAVGVTEEMTPTAAATAEIISVQASVASTMLTWQLSSATDIPLQASLATHSSRSWPDAVLLVDPVGKKSYTVNTMDPGDGYTHCVCSAYPLHVGPDPVRMTSAYPPLPATATSVSVQIPNFAPGTVGYALTLRRVIPSDRAVRTTRR